MLSKRSRAKCEPPDPAQTSLRFLRKPCRDQLKQFLSANNRPALAALGVLDRPALD